MKKFKYILGIQCFANMDSGAAILKCSINGDFLDYVAISEERLIRKKHPYTFPIHSIDYCMKYFNLKRINDIDLLVTDWIRIKKWEFSGPTFNVSEFDYLKDIFKFDKTKIRIISHHLAHAASTFYTSKFKESAILIVDGNGSDIETTTYFKGNQNKINFLENFKYHGIGACYTAVSTRILNMGTGGEGKTMGLAPYGKKYSKRKDFDIKYSLKGIKNNFSGFMDRMPYSDVLNQISPKFRPDPIKIKYKTCKNKKDLTNPYFSSVAYKLQNVTEKTLIHLAKDIQKKTKSKNLCIAGGVGLNSVANKKILDNTKFKKIFIFPACSDSGIPFGLVIWGYYNLDELGIKKFKKTKFENAYLGNSYTPKQIKTCLDKYKIAYSKVNTNKVAELISQGKIIGWFQGRSEYGPRALGNRSILADSRKPEMKDILNKRVKHRESFRPFAPSIKIEYSKFFFELNCPSPYMLLIAKVKKKKIIPSVTHVDGTARVQTVTNDSNKKFYKLIDNFQKITGVPCILNTSFNDAGDPIVETPLDALETFFKCDMDYLYLEEYLIHKKNQKNIQSIFKKISSDIKNEINTNRRIILRKLFRNYSKKNCKKFIAKNNKNSIYNLVFDNINKLELKIKEWLSNKKNILIIGTGDHTNLMFNLFPLISKLNIVGFVNYSKKSKNSFNFLRKIDFKNMHKEKFDEILISSYEYNFDILEELKRYKYKTYSIYENRNRSLLDIYQKKIISLFKKYNSRKNI